MSDQIFLPLLSSVISSSSQSLWSPENRQVSPVELTCETLILLSTNLTARTWALLNQTFTISNSSGLYCDLSVDGIGTCWPRSVAGDLISRPCPEQFNGINYNTTIKGD
ncbi:hypothetical protein PAMP_008602 [Pampus punctatissimus]